jgi:hypothetical protein
LDTNEDLLSDRLLTRHPERLVEPHGEGLAVRVRLPHVERLGEFRLAVGLIAVNINWRGAVHHEHSKRGEAPAGVVVASVDGKGHGVAKGFVHRAFHPVRALLFEPCVRCGRAGVNTEPNPMLRAEGVVDRDAVREWLRDENVGREVLVSTE